MKEKTIDFDLVADLYDVYVNSDLDLAFFLRETEGVSSPILELMAGTGRVSLPLLQRGRKLFCVDYSREMLVRLKEKAADFTENLETREADVRDLKLDGTFERILLPFHSLSEITDPSDQKNVLKSVRDALSKNGVFLLTLQNPKVRLKTADGLMRPMGKFSLPDRKKLILSYWNSYDPKRGIVTGMQFYEIYDSKNTMIEKRFLPIRFRPVFKDQIYDYLAELDYEVLSVFGDYSYSSFEEETSPFMIFKLGK
ncbi:class I SAM-dependent methyltransferase [Leptospira gomenensis]|uniref:Class I SAM-dependent methyltransferase n=1 Tax=Leptospira gomenensis TaxID=2484974 RepID=A0A5F1Z291_9LEPT|nr:class I SAM-dependent methyltransferase [Leptospira gomenensis]TGK35088.1 class I SAM-dependent methyltransferase [Leptospira gomenensis]TGK35234.1 class I SAM-dependent methyltransferase [Leptospira gomenensis]TGK41095.1 class I SAM-dependent methyltransferase [Leptospira gomenensis]TGK67633.1 class I SAM-dependent methyltransferase [Leptospira gomenensis]